MDRDDALRERLVGARGADRPPVVVDRACIRRVHAGDDLGERRLAGAVLADEAANAARDDRKVDAAQRLHRAEPLGQTSAAQEEASAR